jgi:transcriptional regulator with XRE-family HTH domain
VTADVGTRIRILRKGQRLSLAAVAAKANISAATLSRIETSKQPMGLELFLTLARVLDVGAADLLHDGPRDDDEPLAGKIQSLDTAQRTALWRELAAGDGDTAMRGSRNARIETRLEELVAQLDFLREKITEIRTEFRKRRSV